MQRTRTKELILDVLILKHCHNDDSNSETRSICFIIDEKIKLKIFGNLQI
jgi:hypothetical protein